jgi:ABC-2 type transport system ATP-binding protein
MSISAKGKPVARSNDEGSSFFPACLIQKVLRVSQSTLPLAIDLKQVSKVYRGGIHALRGIDLTVSRGQVFGLLGPNGAGKSTLVKIMMTVVRPTHALGTILGQHVGHKPTLRQVGYLPENHRLPKYLTGRQALDFFGALSKVDRHTRRQRIGALLDTVGMTRWADMKLASYSKGMLQRIGLAQAMVHEPELLVLDEPTDGVDPLGRRDILDLIRRLRGEGRTVFVNSHALSELETICDRVAILVQGTVARQGTIDELTADKQYYEVEVATDWVNDRGRGAASTPFPGTPGEGWGGGSHIEHDSRHPLPNPPPEYRERGQTITQRLREALGVKWTESATGDGAVAGTLHGGAAVVLQGNLLQIAATDPAAVQPIIDGLRAAGMTIRRVQLRRPSLEDLFLDTVSEGRP